MQKHLYAAVITGDIVGSGKLESPERARLPEKLKQLFSHLPRLHGAGHRFSIFRGDSFQGVIEEPVKALEAGLRIKTGLMKTDDGTASYDCRMAIGVGKIAFMAGTALESDGEAFRYSGPALDAMDPDERLRIVTPWDEVNQEMHVACRLADEICKRWTTVQAAVIAGTLEGKTQTAIATSLGITQPAVSASLKTSGWDAMEELINRYQTIIKQHVQ